MADNFETETRNRRKQSSNEANSGDLNENLLASSSIKGKNVTYEKPYSFSNICWFVCSVITFYVTDFYTKVRYDERVDRIWFNLGVFMILINVSIAIFLIGWLTAVKKISTDDWEKLYPMAIPVASASFCFGSIFMIIGLWPLWGFLTPFIMGILFMGFVVIVMLVPPYANWNQKPEVNQTEKDL